MTAYHLATFRAAPFCCFFFQELPDTMLFYEIEVFYHAHMVKGTVALIKGLKTAAGEIRAFIAETYKPFIYFVALPLIITAFTAW